MRGATSFSLVLFFSLACIRLGVAEETPVATHWTLINTVEACTLAQAVDVQKELKLSARQANGLKQFVETWRKRNHAFGKANRRPSAEDCQKQYRALLDEAKAIVSLEQLQRLRQIHFQCEGAPAVVVNHEQAATLFKTSPQQRGKLVEIQIASDKQRADAITKRLAAKKNPLDIFKGGREAETQLLQEMNKQALAILDPAQRKAWEQLIGKPFKGRLVNAKGKHVHPRLESL